MKPPTNVTLKWDGEHRFDAKRQGDFPAIRIDASAKTGPGPVDVLVMSLAACTAVDVVDILAKRRTPVESFTVDATADRFDGVPARLTRVLLTYRIDGATVEREHAERAIDLAITKYCSVRDSIKSEIPVDFTLVLNGEVEK